MPRRKQQTPIQLPDRAWWAVAEALAYCGLPARQFYRMLQQGLVPVVFTPEQAARKPKKGKRFRRAYQYRIPRASFIRWFESAGANQDDAA